MLISEDGLTAALLELGLAPADVQDGSASRGEFKLNSNFLAPYRSRASSKDAQDRSKLQYSQMIDLKLLATDLFLYD